MRVVMKYTLPVLLAVCLLVNGSHFSENERRQDEQKAGAADNLRVQLGNRTYYFETTFQGTWPMAHDTCRRLGMSLVSLESSEEHELIVGHIEFLGLPPNTTWYWTSGNNLARREEWVWATGQRASYFQWAPGSPNHSIWDCEEQQFILLDGRADYDWNDGWGFTQEFNFICEQL